MMCRRPARVLLLIVALLLPVRMVAQKSDTFDDVLRLTPYAAVVGLKACGVESRSSWKGLLVNNAIGGALTVGVTYGLKHIVSEDRPDHSDKRSFPSGHSAIAFAGATALHKEYGQQSILYSIAGYAVATAVAIDRVARDRHHWQDVCAGAAIGVLSVELGYWLGPMLTKEKSKKISLAVERY